MTYHTSEKRLCMSGSDIYSVTLFQIIGVVFRVSALHRGHNIMVSFDQCSSSYLVA